MCSLEAMCSLVMGLVFETEAVLTGIIELLIQAQQSSVKIHAVRVVKLPLSPSVFFCLSLLYVCLFFLSLTCESLFLLCIWAEINKP